MRSARRRTGRLQSSNRQWCVILPVSPLSPVVALRRPSEHAAKASLTSAHCVIPFQESLKEDKVKMAEKEAQLNKVSCASLWAYRGVSIHNAIWGVQFR